MTLISRRQLVLGASASSGLLLAGCDAYPPGTRGSLLEATDAFTYRTQRALLPQQTLVREFDRDAISKHFPAINTVNPESEAYHRSRAISFADYRLPVTGLVERPTAFSLSDLKRFPSRTQVTLHSCVDGWSAIGEWTGVQISRILAAVGMKSEARYLLFTAVDGWWDTFDLTDALHPQSLITYGMNGGPLPMQHGAPVRLRMERQLGWKSIKYVTSLRLVDRIDNFKDGFAGSPQSHGYGWFGGI
jgi:DMSO/TMAO reductase YedYZ molybdopterin-dependent catalytic subunit